MATPQDAMALSEKIEELLRSHGITLHLDESGVLKREYSDRSTSDRNGHSDAVLHPTRVED